VIELYPQIKAVHVGAVAVSGALFATRGALALAGRPRLANASIARFTSYAVDTVLLTAAMMLVAILPSALFANHWLAVKLALVVVYVGLGIVAMRRAALGQRGATLWFVAALATFVVVVGIALAHHPLGWLLEA
jgi:uncharacterized membrane protein SirB2